MSVRPRPAVALLPAYYLKIYLMTLMVSTLQARKGDDAISLRFPPISDPAGFVTSAPLVALPVYFTASMTRAILPKISAMSFSLRISGGVSAMVSPVILISTPSSWNAFSIAA
jgi:hypothetical protein